MLLLKFYSILLSSNPLTLFTLLSRKCNEQFENALKLGNHSQDFHCVWQQWSTMRWREVFHEVSVLKELELDLVLNLDIWWKFKPLKITNLEHCFFVLLPQVCASLNTLQENDCDGCNSNTRNVRTNEETKWSAKVKKETF